jgi:hypothetical protein
MKRLIGSIVFLVLICCYLWSCEKDDLCPATTPTTPNLIVRFYNTNNHALLKKVIEMKVFMEGRDTVTLGTVDSIALPLRTDGTSTKWGIKYNRGSNGVALNDIDFLEFKYTTREEYVSRACGYKVLFNLNSNSSSNPNPVVTDNPVESHLWIDDIEVVNTNIENQNAAHVKIFF